MLSSPSPQRPSGHKAKIDADGEHDRAENQNEKQRVYHRGGSVLPFAAAALAFITARMKDATLSRSSAL